MDYKNHVYRRKMGAERMKNITDLEHCDIIDNVCPYEHSCSVCRLHTDYEAAKEKALKLTDKKEDGQV